MLAHQHCSPLFEEAFGRCWARNCQGICRVPFWTLQEHDPNWSASQADDLTPGCQEVLSMQHGFCPARSVSALEPVDVVSCHLRISRQELGERYPGWQSATVLWLLWLLDMAQNCWTPQVWTVYYRYNNRTAIVWGLRVALDVSSLLTCKSLCLIAQSVPQWVLRTQTQETGWTFSIEAPE